MSCFWLHQTDLVLVRCIRVTYAKSMILWPEIPVIPDSSSTTCSAHEPNSLESFEICTFEASNKYLNTPHSDWQIHDLDSGAVPFPMLRYDEWRRPQRWLPLPEAWSPRSQTQTWLCYKHKLYFILLCLWINHKTMWRLPRNELWPCWRWSV